jgi:rhodanese-related sulfurtransferase
VKIPGLTPQQLDAKRSSVTIVDLRMDKTIIGMGLFPGAVHAPMPKLTKMIDKIDKSKPIVLIDYNGKQFPSAGSYLKANGFSDVSGLQGGLTNWLQQGFALQQ